jgi:hypothetical protein
MLRIVPALALAVVLAACGQSDGATAPGGSSDGATATADAPPPAPTEPPTIPPPPPAHPLDVGSQSARDDLYCSAVIYAANPQPPNALNPIDEAILQKARTLGFIIGEEGINKLVTEKAAHATHAAVIADAYADQVDKDTKANKLRISLDECNKRAAALPIPQ